MSKDRYAPKESVLRSVPLAPGVQLLLDRDTCRELGMAMPLRGYRFKPNKIPLKKRKKWLRNL